MYHIICVLLVRKEEEHHEKGIIASFINDDPRFLYYSMRKLRIAIKFTCANVWRKIKFLLEWMCNLPIALPLVSIVLKWLLRMEWLNQSIKTITWWYSYGWKKLFEHEQVLRSVILLAHQHKYDTPPALWLITIVQVPTTSKLHSLWSNEWYATANHSFTFPINLFL